MLREPAFAALGFAVEGMDFGGVDEVYAVGARVDCGFGDVAAGGEDVGDVDGLPPVPGLLFPFGSELLLPFEDGRVCFVEQGCGLVDGGEFDGGDGPVLPLGPVVDPPAPRGVVLDDGAVEVAGGPCGVVEGVGAPGDAVGAGGDLVAGLVEGGGCDRDGRATWLLGGCSGGRAGLVVCAWLAVWQPTTQRRGGRTRGWWRSWCVAVCVRPFRIHQ